MQQGKAGIRVTNMGDDLARRKPPTEAIVCSRCRRFEYTRSKDARVKWPFMVKFKASTECQTHAREPEV
jgi:hypothetical protein